MKLNKATIIPMGVTAMFTILVIALINNTGALSGVKDTVNGNKGWY